MFTFETRMMGSGSSKSSKDSGKSGNSSSAIPIQKSVANVNKQEKQKSQVDDKKEISSSNQVNAKDSNTRDSDNERNKQNKSKGKSGKKMAAPASDYNSRLQFEEDSDINDDIDEVLKIPTSHDMSKKNKKDTKKLEIDKENNYNYIQSNTQQDLPETYAQRLQRKQYKLQQDILIREKTIIRNSRDWEDDDDDNNHSDKEMGSPNRFDASKFRAANKGEQKKDVFTVKEDMRTPRYMHSPDQSLDDIGITRKDDTLLYKQPPSYDTEELDLMRQLEEELL